jgi:hypothetical protein
MNLNLIQEEMKRLNSGKACYHSVQTLLYSTLSKNIQIRIHKIIILLVVLYGCEFWSDNKGGTQTAGVCKRRAENICCQRGMKKLHNNKLHNQLFLPKIIGMKKSIMR